MISYNKDLYQILNAECHKFILLLSIIISVSTYLNAVIFFIELSLSLWHFNIKRGFS